MPDILNREIWEGRYFDGKWKTAPERLPVIAPATQAVLGSAGCGAPPLAVELCNRAADAQLRWRRQSADARAAVLHAAADRLESSAAAIADWIINESGSIRGKAEAEVRSAIGELRHSAAIALAPPGVVLPSPDGERASLAERIPLGVVVAITPWNFPLVLAMRSVAPALALGNAVVLKPDPQTPVSGGVAIARLFEQAGLPEGVLSVLPGGVDVGEALVTAPAVRMVTFTGSTAAGRRVGELAGRHLKKVALELGGNNAMVILDDCDLDLAASAGAFGSFFHQGQICMATGRHIVLRQVADAYIERLGARAAALKVGDPAQLGTMVGPLINERQLAKVHDIVTQTVAAGADLVTGGKFEGQFYHPTVLGRVSPSMRAFREEIFGPVAPVSVAEDEDHAIALANDTEYGLSAAVQTGSVQRGMRLARELRAGQVHVNDQTVNDRPECPMGGLGQSGNGSRFGSLTAWEEFTEWRWLTSGERQVAYPF